MVDRKLGRGLDFFLSAGNKGAVQQSDASLQSFGHPKRDELLVLPIGELSPNPHQPRSPIRAEELTELAASIKESGILQPILVRQVGGRYQIVAGERRWRAAKVAGLDQVPVFVKTLSDDDSATVALVENVQRTDLNAIEKARAFQQLLSRTGWSQEDLATRVGLDRSSVANFLRLLILPADVQAHVSRGTLSMGHARALLGLKDAALMLKLADDCIRTGTSVRELESRIRASSLEAPESPVVLPRSTRTQRPAWLSELEEALTESLGTPVTVRHGRKRSQVVIECVGRDELERILRRIKDSPS